MTFGGVKIFTMNETVDILPSSDSPRVCCGPDLKHRPAVSQTLQRKAKREKITFFFQQHVIAVIHICTLLKL